MASGTSEQAWDNFLDQHQSIVSLLNTHASLLVGLRKHSDASSHTLDLIQTRLYDIEAFVATLQQSNELLREKTNPHGVGSVPGLPLPTPNVPSEPFIDPSGLFTVDTNPTPLDQLVRLNNSKRKSLDHESRGDNIDGDEARRKRARPSDQNKDSEADDSFERGVEARVRAREDRMKAKHKKKRKRPSDASISAGSKGPKDKKQKQRHESKTSASKPLAVRPIQSSKRPNTDGRQNGQPNKKRKKTKA